MVLSVMEGFGLLRVCLWLKGIWMKFVFVVIFEIFMV